MRCHPNQQQAKRTYRRVGNYLTPTGSGFLASSRKSFNRALTFGFLSAPFGIFHS
jgi:hypothetical protein